MNRGLVPHVQGDSTELSPYAPGGPPMRMEEPDNPLTIPWGRYLAAIRRYRWLILVLTVCGTGAGVLATRFLKPTYTVSATIFVEQTPKSPGPIRPEVVLENSGWAELVHSWVVLDSTVLRLKLFLEKSPEDSAVFRDFQVADQFATGTFTLAISPDGNRMELQDRRGQRYEAVAPGDSIGRAIGFRWAPSAAVLGRGRRITFSLLTPREASARLSDELEVNLPKDGNFLNLTLAGQNPQRQADILNTISEQFVGVAADLKKRKLQVLASTLEEQVKSTHAQLEHAEGALESFRTRTITLPNESGVPVAGGLVQTQPTVITNFFKQKIELENLKTDRKNLESVLAKTQAGELAVDAFQTIPAVRNAPDLSRALTELSNQEAELRALQNRYTDDYKPLVDLKGKISKLRQETIPAYANALIDQLKAQESADETQIASAASDMQQIPQRTIMEQRLTREAQSSAALAELLDKNYEETKLALASSIPDVRILVPAVAPTRPNRNTAPIIILAGLMAGFGGGIGLAIILDQFDKRFRYPEQVTQELGLSILGAVPAIRKNGGKAMSEEEASQVVEAFRTIRLNLAHSYGTAGPVMLTISSPGPGEGKSFVSSNLALSFAEAGYRTLLIDGDIRRGELHRMFSIDRRPGLMDHLAGACSLDDVVRPSGHQGLSVVACGTRRHQGPELLGSAAMNLFMAEMKSRYNVIIVDSPPLGAGIDPFVLSTSTGHMMLVLRSGETDRALAEAKLKLLDRLPIRLLGAVLNDIRAAEGAYKYYGYVYGYSAEEDGAPAQISSRAGEIS